MKKAVLGIVAILVIGALALPPVLGIMTESRFRESLTSMDGHALVALDIESYDRGWFSSLARISIGVDPDYARTMMGVDDPNSANGLAAAFVADAKITFIVDIDHGPLVLRNGLYVGLSRFVARPDPESEVVRELQTRLAMPYLVEVRGRLGLFGRFEFDGDVPPIDYADEDGAVLFSGLLVDGSYRGRNLLANGRIDELSFDSVDAAGQIRGVSFAGDTEWISRYLWIGDAEFGIDNIILTNPIIGEEMLNVDGLHISADADVDDAGELMRASLSYKADSVEAEPEIVVTNAELTIGIENFAVAALNAYNEALATLDPNDPFAALGFVRELGAQLLERDPSIEIAPLRFEYLGEPFNANIELRTAPGAGQGGIDLANPMLLAGLFEVSADAVVSKTLAQEIATMVVEGQLSAALADQELPPGESIAQMAAQQAEVMLATFAAQGLILETGDTYTTNIEYAGGEITINGTPLPLGMMFQ